MNVSEDLEEQIAHVANRLGARLCNRMAFVGGCVTGLLVSDPIVRETIRATKDIDLIVDVIGFADYVRLQESLRKRGFRESMNEEVICRWSLDDLTVDIMPTDENILTFSNRWYPDAIRSAFGHEIRTGTKIHIVSPPFFLATKIEAFLGRGDGDFLASRDIEDILTLLDGRPEVEVEIAAQNMEFRQYIAGHFSDFLSESSFEYALESVTREQSARTQALFQRIQRIAQKG